jgi:IS30 family transposase
MDNFKIEERRRKVRSLLAEGNTEVDIAKLLGVGQATVSRDITALKEDSQKYIYDLAKTDLAYSYGYCVNIAYIQSQSLISWIGKIESSLIDP